ncbi:MAG: hypothetical protein ABW092_08685 [Candidatus Thiodiazotropha sp.]
MKTGKGLLFLFLLSLAASTLALEGWTTSDDGGLRLYFPNDIQRDKVFMYVASGPYDLNGADVRQWFSKQVQQMQDRLGKPLAKWDFKSVDSAWSTSNQYVDKKRGVQMNIAYEGGKLDSDRAYVIAMISSADISVLSMLKYGFAINKVRDNAKQYLSGRASVTALANAGPKQGKNKPAAKPKQIAKDKPKQIKERIRVAPGEGADIDDIEFVWVYSDIDVVMGGIEVYTHLLFEDGTAYRNCRIPPDELDIEVSKRVQPRKWTEWRKKRGVYQMKNKKKGTWYNLRGGPGIMAPEGTELSGKFLNAGGSQYSGSWKKHIIFHDDGRFEMSSFSMQSNSGMGGGNTTPLLTSVHSSNKHGSSANTNVIGSNVGGGVSSKRKDGSKNKGSYQVNDYTITMLHDNGYSHTELFLYEKRKNEKNIVYGNDLYWLDD